MPTFADVAAKRPQPLAMERTKSRGRDETRYAGAWLGAAAGRGIAASPRGKRDDRTAARSRESSKGGPRRVSEPVLRPVISYGARNVEQRGPAGRRSPNPEKGKAAFLERHLDCIT
jgi:hypothetical protein